VLGNREPRDIPSASACVQAPQRLRVCEVGRSARLLVGTGDSGDDLRDRLWSRIARLSGNRLLYISIGGFRLKSTAGHDFRDSLLQLVHCAAAREVSELIENWLQFLQWKWYGTGLENPRHVGLDEIFGIVE